MTFSWKLLILAVLIVLPTLVVISGQGYTPALANVTNVASSDTSFTSGGNVGIIISLDTTNGTSSVIVTADGALAGTIPVLTVVDCNPDCTSEEDESGSTVTISADDRTQVSLTLTATCPVSDVITVTADQGAGPSDSVDIDCDATTGGGSGSGFGIAAIAVVASPNVIPCGGTALITATARDSTGHIINGLAFHFATDIGTLVVGPPNTADALANSAILSFAPGLPPAGGSATVQAWVGDSSENPGVVLVQQFCLGVTTDSSTAPGLISMTSSSPQMNCGDSAFIGVRVRDSKNQVPADGTVVNFLTNSGTLAPTSDATVNGVLNIMFTASGSTSSGSARITAASGDAFGSITLPITCQAATTAGATGTAGRAPAPCVPIGDGICITPPNTGDGGLKE